MGFATPEKGLRTKGSVIIDVSVGKGLIDLMPASCGLLFWDICLKLIKEM